MHSCYYIRKALRSKFKTWGRYIVKRDGKCKICGATENLTAHHVTSLKELIEKYNLKTIDDVRDCDELWDRSLGECVCERCHRKVDSRPKIGKVVDKFKGDGWKFIREQ